jgi:hypothetical protein
MINSAIPIISPCAPQDDGFRKGSTHATALSMRRENAGQLNCGNTQAAY